MKKFIQWTSEPEHAIVIHAIGFVFWLVLAGTALLLGFIGSTVFISVLSIVALSLSHWSAIQAAMADLRIKKDNGDS